MPERADGIQVGNYRQAQREPAGQVDLAVSKGGLLPSGLLEDRLACCLEGARQL